MKSIQDLIVAPGHKLKLSKRDPGDDLGLGKEDAKSRLEKNLEKFAGLQHVMYAQNKHALLIVLQGMDTAGKDGVIRDVMTAFNPQGCHVTSFGVPSSEELDHDFLWRIHKAAPARGDVAIFNRSHYEDVLVVRVHSLVPNEVWAGRYRLINLFEELLASHEVKILKFFLHISKEEQKVRLQERIDNKEKNWKMNPSDLEERKFWDDYQRAYEEALQRCSTDHAPWFIIPSDKKWVRNLAISQMVVEALEGLRMRCPKPRCDLSRLVVK